VHHALAQSDATSFSALENLLLSARSVGVVLGLSMLLSTAFCVATEAPATASTAPSTLCSGYTGCDQGTFTTHGYQNHSESSYWTMNPGDNCTNYVAYVESTAYQVPTPTFDLGNGGQWATAAAEHGVLVNNTPAVGSVAVWSGASSGIPDEGHVAIVEAVGPNNSYIVISQQHMLDDANGYDWTVINADASQNQWEQWPDSFIHFSTGPTALTSLALATTANIIVRVMPLKFAVDTFIFYNRLGQAVTPGVPTNLKTGGSAGDYAISFQKSSLETQYVLRLSVQGSNVRVLHQGGPYTNDQPSLRIIGVGNPQSPSVVTLTVQRGTASPTTTTTAPSGTTTTQLGATTTAPPATSSTLAPLLKTQLLQRLTRANERNSLVHI
jgi:surface antigen